MTDVQPKRNRKVGIGHLLNGPWGSRLGFGGGTAIDRGRFRLQIRRMTIRDNDIDNVDSEDEKAEGCPMPHKRSSSPSSSYG